MNSRPETGRVPGSNWFGQFDSDNRPDWCLFVRIGSDATVPIRTVRLSGLISDSLSVSELEAQHMTENELQSLQKHFRPGIGIDEPLPFNGWLPSPDQLAEFTAAVRSEWTPQETFRRLRSDLRPTVRAADSRQVDVSAEDYEQHQSFRATTGSGLQSHSGGH